MRRLKKQYKPNKYFKPKGYRTKLTEGQAREIKFGLRDKTIKELALQFGVSLSTIAQIRNGVAWEWIKE